MLSTLFPWLVTGFLILLGFTVGGFRERGHFKKLARRETAAADIMINNMKSVTDPASVLRAQLVAGNVVIATDYFKTVATNLRNLVGGEMVTAQRLMLRARREAVMRMLDEAREIGATEVWNIRFQFCNIQQMSNSQKGAMSVEMYAYGTAIVRKPQGH